MAKPGPDKQKRGLYSDIGQGAREIQRRRKQAAERGLIGRWDDDPVLFAQEAFNINPTDEQIEILESVRDRNRTAARSGHKVGKTTIAVIAALWWCYVKTMGRVLATAPTTNQLRGVLWRETRIMCRRAQKAGKIWLPEPAKLPHLGMQWPDEREFVGLTTDQGESISGFSGAEILILVDEASGVPEKIHEALRGNLAGGGHLLLISNPTQPSGTFKDAFTTKREIYSCHHFSSEESPNIVWPADSEIDEHGCRTGTPTSVPADQIVPGLALAEYIIEARIDYGPNYQENPLYQIRVCGNFAKQSEMCIVPVGLVEAGAARWKETIGVGGLAIGLDVAHFGDDETVMAPGRGPKIYNLITFRGFEERRTTKAVAEYIRDNYRVGEPKVQVKIDVGGGYGSEVASRLRDPEDDCWTKLDPLGSWLDADPPVEVIELNGSNKSERLSNTGQPMYHNLRAEMWFGITEWLKAGGALPPDDTKMHTELVTPIYKFDKQERRQAEAKPEVKRRIKRSPDRGDAVAMYCHNVSGLEVEAPDEEDDEDQRWEGDERGY